MILGLLIVLGMMAFAVLVGRFMAVGRGYDDDE